MIHRPTGTNHVPRPAGPLTTKEPPCPPHRRPPRFADRHRLHACRTGKEGELRKELEALIEPTSREAGYVDYDLHESAEQPGAFFFHENWGSAEHLGDRRPPHPCAGGRCPVPG